MFGKVLISAKTQLQKMGLLNFIRSSLHRKNKTANSLRSSNGDPFKYFGEDQLHVEPASGLLVNMFKTEDEGLPDSYLIALGDQKQIGSIVQLMIKNSTQLLLMIDEHGILYTAGSDQPKPTPVTPFDGKGDWRAVYMTFYTESTLFIARNAKDDSFAIFAEGNNSYYRLSRFKPEDYLPTKPEMVFSPSEHLKQSDRVVTSIGCCYSFSACVLDETEVHMTGQDWMCGGDLVQGYHCWSKVLQRFTKKIVKMECGDFHIILMHEDGSISVGGSNSSNQFTVSHPGVSPFYEIPLNVLSVKNVLSASNGALFVTGKDELIISGRSIEGFTYEDKESEPKIFKGIQLEAKDHFLENPFDIQMSRDYVITRFPEEPHLMLLSGRLYHYGTCYTNFVFDLKKAYPFEKHSTRHRIDDFYRHMVKVAPFPTGFVVYCQKSPANMIRFFDMLLQSLGSSEHHNRLFDISFAF